MLFAFKIKLALACAAGLAGPLAIAPLVMENGAPDISLRHQQATVELLPGSISYRVNGDFTHAGKQASAPLARLAFADPVAIMRHQVSSFDYERCVDDGACRPLDRGVVVATDRAAVQISWHDANTYAGWLSHKTGETYRLPTDEEWVFAAGSKFKDDGVSVDENDPSKRWIARYEREADRAPSDAGTRIFGSFGVNENGLQDVGGNVWEWTSTCFVRHVLDDAGNVVSKRSNCGVRVVEGQHRAYVTDFIRDAKAGGCAVGVPPDNLGFRLVREPKATASLIAARICAKSGGVCDAIQSLAAGLTKILGASLVRRRMEDSPVKAHWQIAARVVFSLDVGRWCGPFFQGGVIC